jgi:hypothetical protein
MDESTHSYIITFSPLFVCAGEVGEEPSLHGDTLLLQFSFLFYLSYGRGANLLLCGMIISCKGTALFVSEKMKGIGICSILPRVSAKMCTWHFLCGDSTIIPF